MRYEALLLRHAKFSDNHHLKVSREEWSTFAKDALHDGFYNIASKVVQFTSTYFPITVLIVWCLPVKAIRFSTAKDTAQ